MTTKPMKFSVRIEHDEIPKVMRRVRKEINRFRKMLDAKRRTEAHRDTKTERDTP